ncbi:MAG TPA: hypothetical protein VIX86_20125 [Streptosporangiaceae bacterium]
MTGAGTSGARETAEPAQISDLLCGAAELAERLRAALAGEQWLDAYLFAAGLSQLVEDRLHADPFLFWRAASYLRDQPSRPARLAGTASAACGSAARAWRSGPRRPLLVARQQLGMMTSRLASQLMTGQPPGELAPPLAAVAPALSQLAGDVMRVPACFHSFDLHPDDVRWLASAFRQRYPASDVPLCVVGVRTSGCYLAPLHAAALRAEGGQVRALTYRPGRPFLPGERAVLRATAGAGGLVLVTDDPPGAGTAFAATARAVAEAGVPGTRIVLLLPLFGSADDLPDLLRPWPAVVQPWPEWSVHARLAAGPVGRALAALAGPGRTVTGVEPLGPPRAAGERGHVRARFAVQLTDRVTGTVTSTEVLAEGAGLGYLGRQGTVVAGALPGQVPHVYGFADGFLYRDWLPGGGPPVPEQALAETIAGYVAARRAALPAPTAAVDRLGGRDPVWEVAARLLSGQFGPLAVPARPLLLDRLTRRLLGHGHPAVADGKTGHQHWLPDPAAAGGLRKVDFYQRGFGHLDLACYDPVFDLAGAAADPPSPEFEARLREAYRLASGEQVDAERWLLYRLAQLWRLGCANDLDHGRVRQLSAAAVHDYLAARYLPDLKPGAGPLCAIDLDGVLECDRLGYPATSPTGLLTIRALIAHGYRPVLVSGRSLADVRDRCTAFGLPGGVAEYGAVTFRPEAVTDLRSRAARRLLDRVRRELSACPGVRVNPAYQHSVRATAGGGPIPAGLLAGIPLLADPGLRIIQGEGQTDIVAASTDKGTGLRALAAQLGGPGCAFAVGDTPPDLPLLATAALARAPRNARLGPDGGWVKLTRRSYQGGLREAATDLLGHPPGRCPLCRPPAFTPRTRAVLALLDLRSHGLASIPGRSAAATALLARSARW